jgi:hypothetical protein
MLVMTTERVAVPEAERMLSRTAAVLKLVEVSENVPTIEADAGKALVIAIVPPVVSVFI